MLTKSIPKPVSKINLIQFYKPILIMLLICGFDFNVWKFKMCFKIFVTAYCLFLVMFNVFANIECCSGQLLTTTWSVIEYAASVIATLVLKNQLTNYFQKLTDIDAYLKVGTKYYSSLRNKMVLFTFILWLIRLVYTILYCFWFPYFESFSLFLISQFSLLALDLNRVWRFILFDMTRYRLKMLRCRLEEMKHCNYYCYVSNFKTIKQSSIRFCLDLYKHLADALDIITPELHASLFISIVCTVPKIIMNAYHIILVVESLEPFASVGFAALHVTQVTLFIFAPCVVVEQYGVEVERMRLLLVHMLLDDPDQKTKDEVNLFLRYTDFRPFRYRVWRILPVTIVLPLDLLNLCTTYIIVLINFSNLF